MDLWEMTGLSPRQGLLVAVVGLAVAAALALRGVLRKSEAEERRGDGKILCAAGADDRNAAIRRSNQQVPQEYHHRHLI